MAEETPDTNPPVDPTSSAAQSPHGEPAGQLPPLTTTPNTSTANDTGPEGDLDLANRSLSDALGLSFRVLKVVMFLLLIVFLFSGFFWVDQNEVAVRTRFGRITEASDGSRVLTAEGGPFFAFPSPIDRVYRIPTTRQTLELDRSYWPEVPPGQTLEQLQTRGALEPGQDGSLVTGDKNIVHAQWTVEYRIPATGAADYVANVLQLDRTGDLPVTSDQRPDPLQGARPLVQAAVEQAVVELAAGASVEDFIRGVYDETALVAAAQQVLDALNSGIAVDRIILRDPIPPVAVRDAFRAVSEAESERAQLIEQADQEWQTIHTAAAGEAWQAVLFAIDEYEEARRTGDTESQQRAESAINALFEGQPAAEALVPLQDVLESEAERQRLASLMTNDRIGGEAASRIAQARGDATQIVSRTQAEAETFSKLLESYQAAPQLTKQRLYQALRRDVLGGDTETIYLPPNDGKAIVLDLNPDPAIERERREQALQQQRQGGPQ